MLEAREIMLRLAMALAVGVMIGAERQFRRKGAGLRTNVLVALGAAVFCLISAATEREMSATRIAAQVASGVGFLGAGLIIRDGLNVRGLDTAATIWCSAAVGATAGSGLYVVSAAASLVILGTNVFLRPRVPRADALDAPAARPIRYRLAVQGQKDVQTAVRDCVLGLGGGATLLLESISVDPGSCERFQEVKATFSAERRDDLHLGRVTCDLATLPGVVSASWRYVPPQEVELVTAGMSQ